MKRIVLAPDSFKGTMSAGEVCAIQRRALEDNLPGVEVLELPMADGGEGLTEACIRLQGGTRVDVRVTGPLHQEVDAFYGVLLDGSAVIEMSAAAGLPLMGEHLAPLHATTYGVGQLILHAVRRGCRRILLGLGGSATNDCGVGMAAALGYRFYDETGQAVEPLAKNLGQITRISLERPLPPIEISAACDVDNPLCGPHGATAVFGPQKGVTPGLYPGLEAGVRNLASIMERECGRPVADCPGAGAAGGLGAGVLFFLRGDLRPGVELLLDAAYFDTLLEDASLVLTGEGRMDAQSVRGKVPAGVARRCQHKSIPCIALCGSLGEGAEAMYACGVTAMFSAVRGLSDMDSIRRTCRADMAALTESLARLLRTCGPFSS